MSNFILLLLLLGPTLFGQREKVDPKIKIASRPVPKAPVVKRHPDGRPLGIPYDAVKINDGAWRTVEKGTPVIYRNGPFGIYQVSEAENKIVESRLSGKPIDNSAAPENLSVTEEGDKLHFRATTPFGPGPDWVKDKNDLTPAERTVWEKKKSEKSGAAKK